MERLSDISLDQLHSRLLENEPKLINMFVPSNGDEQKRLFLEGEVRNPDHNYPKLNQLDIERTDDTITHIGNQILSHTDLNPKFMSAYAGFIETFHAKTQLLKLARQYKRADTPETQSGIGKDFLELESKLYEEPEEATYRSLLGQQIKDIRNKHLTGRASNTRDELFALLGHYAEDTTAPERFRPSSETLEWMHGVAETLYGGLLSHIPAQDHFTVEETATLFQSILNKEFGEAAEGWTVDIAPAKAINVRPSERRIIIPPNRGAIGYEKLRGLVVHEIGVHVLRSINGYATDFHPLATGLDGYYDYEEGLATVMEQSLKGDYSESGIPLYLTAGTAYFDRRDFRDTFETHWRLSALDKLNDGQELTDDAILAAKNTAYARTMRIMRGTDALPWFKDLAYYNGTTRVWQHLESIRGDDIKFMFLLMGKTNPQNIADERLLYETRSI